MKLYQYLNESRSKSLTLEQFEQLKEQNCSHITENYKNNKVHLYRGIHNKSPFLYTNPTKEKRVSRNTENYYTLLFDEILPSWNGWPKRSKSVITISNIDPFHSPYGSLYRVFPYNNTKIAQCINYDIWVSFENNLHLALDDFNVVLNYISTYYNIKIGETKHQLLQFIKDVDNIKEINNNAPYKANNFIQQYQESNKTFFNYLNDVLSPVKNKFKILSLTNKIDCYKETWIEGECLLEKI